MKIHRVEIENLNSLYGAHAIDFDGDLADSAVFLIVGPTGAGKTTILDAICLALFGETPRLERRRGDSDTDSRHAMSRGTGHCRAAVVFSKRGGDGRRTRFRAEWSCHRSRQAPGGNLQTPQRSLECVDVGGATVEVLVSTGQKRATEAVFHRVLEGLDVADFKRSMVLAQGGFAAFLHASGDERASILERLTDTEIYREIGARVADEMRQARAAWEACRTGLGLAEGQLLDAAALNLLEERAAAARDAEAGLNLAVESARAGEQWWVRREALEARCVEIEGQLAQAQSAWDARAADVARLAEDRRCRPVGLHLGAVRRLRAETAILDDDVPRLQAAALAAESVRDEAAVEHAAASAERATAEAAYEGARESLAEARRLRQAAAAAADEDDKARDALARAEADEAGATQALERAELALIAATQERDVAVAELGRARHLEALEAQLPALRARSERLEARRSELERARSETARLDGRAESAVAALAEARAAFDLASVAVRAARTARAAAAETLLRLVRRGSGEPDTEAGPGATWTAGDVARRGAGEPDAAAEERRAMVASVEALFHVAGEGANESDAGSGTRAATGTSGDEGRIDDLALRAQLGAVQVSYAGEIVALDTRIEAVGDALRHLETLSAVREGRRVRRARIESDSLALGEAQLALRAERRAEAATYRDLLGDDEPCPVCGSCTHPAAHDAVPTSASRGARDRVAALTASLEEQRSHEANDADWEARLEAELRLLVLERAGLDVEWTPEGLGEASAALRTRRREANEASDALTAAAEMYEQAVSRAADADHHQAQAAVRCDTAAERVTESRSEADRAAEGARRLADGLAEDSVVLLSEGCALAGTARPDLATGAVAEMLATADVLVAGLGRLRAAAEGAAHTLERATDGLDQARIQRRGADKRIRERRRDADARKQTLEGLRRDEFLVLAGRDPDEVEAGLRAAITEAGQAERNLGAALDAAAVEAARARTSAQERARLREERHREQEEVTVALRAGLGALGLAREEDLDAALLPEAEELQLSAQLKPIEDALTSARALHAGAAADRDGHMGLRPPDLDPEVDRATLERLRQQAERALGQHNAEKAHVAALLAEQARQAERVAQGRAQLDAATAHLALWQDLHDLVGVGDGARFKQFAQSLNLQELVDLANVRLERLAPRYALRVATGDDGLPTLGFGIHDAHQAGAERPVTTLSGGETFLVSLSLALALADCRSTGMPIETLLLDEGLGTLDQETLGVAMDALERLKGRDTQIGIITHVEGLQQRIPARIQVVPQGGGRSRIEVRVD